MTHYKDKDKEFAAYRMMLAGIDVGVMMAAVIAAVAIDPQISALSICLICAGLILASLVVQVWLDHRMILSGESLIEDGEALYVVIGIFGLGFGKRHRKNRHVNAYRYYMIDKVEAIKEMSVGIRFRAKVWTATSGQIGVDKSIFKEPGAMRRELTEHGRHRTVTFRMEHVLQQREEKRFLWRLEDLQK